METFLYVISWMGFAAWIAGVLPRHVPDVSRVFAFFGVCMLVFIGWWALNG